MQRNVNILDRLQHVLYFRYAAFRVAVTRTSLTESRCCSPGLGLPSAEPRSFRKYEITNERALGSRRE
jgi:hypothetical protein